MMIASALDSASKWLNWSNALYVGGAALTLVAAMYVLHENRLITSGRRQKYYLISEILVVLAAVTSLMGTIGAIHFSNVISHLKDNDLVAYKKSADLQIAKANAAAGVANQNAGIANQKAEEARLKAETTSKENATLRNDVLKGQAESKKAEAVLSAQNQQTSQFAHALQMQQANMAEQMHASPVLDKQQIENLAGILKPFSGQEVILHSTSDTTVLRTKVAIQQALSLASITFPQNSIDMGMLYKGISVVVHAQDGHPPLADALVLGLRQAGITVTPVALDTVPQGKVAIYFGPN